MIDEGLKVHEADNSLCCFARPHLDGLVHSFKTKEIVTLCTGCYNLFWGAMKDRGDYRLKMLPEVVWGSLEGTGRF